MKNSVQGGARVYDIHCHILPGLDDGSPTPQKTMRMASMAAKNGTSQIICTPHCSTNDPNLGDRLQEILECTEEMNALLSDAEIPVTLLPGMELLCNGSLQRLLANGIFLTLAQSRYMLLEFPFNTRYSFINEAAQEVSDSGLRPVIAHPERYDCVQRDPERVAQWLSWGWLIQVNRGSLTGSLGLSAQRTSQWLMYRRMAHFCASDGHGTNHRMPELLSGYNWIARHCSEDYALLVTETNPRRLIRDHYIPNPSI